LIAKRTYFWLLLVFIILTFQGCTGKRIDLAKDGVLDIKSWNFAEKGIITLDGEWTFYWQQLLEPKDFDTTKANHFINLPNVWNNLTIDNETISGKGYATLRLQIRNNLKNEKLGLRVPFHFTSYKLWVNDALMAENGIVAKTKQTSKPQTLPKYIYFDAPDGDIYLTLQISNYHYDKGGAPAAYKMGLASQIRDLHIRQFAFDLFLIGSLFIMAFHHLGLYFLRKKEISTLYFSLVCFLISLRTFSLGETLIIQLYPDFNFEIYTKFIFLGLFLSPVFFILFIEQLFPKETIPKIRNILVGLGILFSISLFFPGTVTTKVLIPYFLVLASSLLYPLFIIIKACSLDRKGAYIALFGMCVIIITSFNDILFDMHIINTDYYSQYGLFVFVLSQSFLLSLKFSLAFLSVENLSIHIKKINTANSRFVPTEFLSFLGKESVVDVNLGDNVTKHMTIFFADIRSFTSLSESMTPEENFIFINSLLKRLSPIIRKNNGFIDKFIGDSIMALFPDNPKDAVTTGWDVLKELDNFNQDRIKDGLIPIRMGIGINSGSLMLGTIGEEKRMDGTVISDSVNLAARLEDLTKVFGANMIVSENVIHDIKDNMNIEYRFLGKIVVKGKAELVAIYEIFSFDDEVTRNIKHQTKHQFEQAVDLYQQDFFEKAKIILIEILNKFPEDKATLFYLDKISTKI